VGSAVAWGLAVAAPVTAVGDSSVLAVRVADPPPLAFDATALGRATRPIRIVLSNPGSTALALTPLLFRFRPLRDGVSFACEDPQGSDDRWPKTLEPGSSFMLARDLTCETPLPGHYDVEIRGRARGTDETERTYGSFGMDVEAGSNPPVRLPWDASLHAAAAGTREMRPTRDTNRARILVAMINGSRSPVTLAPVHATFKVTRRGSRLAPCPERTVSLAFEGSLAPGRMQTLGAGLGCDLSAEAIYDVDISIANAAGSRVKVGTQAIRVGVLPPPPPRPEDNGQARIHGGM